MSWYSGSHDTSTSSSASSPAAVGDGVEVGADRAVREHHALRVGGGAAGELQDGERVRVVDGSLEVGRSDAQAADVVGSVARQHHRRVAGLRLDERREVGVDDDQVDVGVRPSVARVWATNSSIEPSRIGSGSTTSVAPHSHTAWMAVTSGRVVGPSRATWPPAPTPRPWSAAASWRASSCSRPSGTRSASSPVDEGDGPAAAGGVFDAGRETGLRAGGTTRPTAHGPVFVTALVDDS